MASPARKLPPPVTWDDLDDVAEGFIGEIVGGELVVTPRPNEPHGCAQSSLTVVVGAPFMFGMGGGPGGWVIRVEPRIRFGEDVRVPDVAGWRKERFFAPKEGPITVSPDWICEVLSESTAATDRAVKMPLYAKHKVGHLWLVDTALQLLDVYRLLGDKWLVAGTFTGAARVRAEPFEAVEIDLSLLWEEQR